MLQAVRLGVGIVQSTPSRSTTMRSASLCRRTMLSAERRPLLVKTIPRVWSFSTRPSRDIRRIIALTEGSDVPSPSASGRVRRWSASWVRLNRGWLSCSLKIDRR